MQAFVVNPPPSSWWLQIISHCYLCVCLVGSYDHFLNFQISFIIMLQLAMCIFCAVGSYIWRKYAGYPRYQLAMDAYVEGNYQNGLAYTLILLITFWILYSYLVPISLFVTLEIVKFWQVRRLHAHCHDSTLQILFSLLYVKSMSQAQNLSCNTAQQWFKASFDCAMGRSSDANCEGPDAAQGFVYINTDKEMIDPVSGNHALARNTNLNEDLGKVEYVFSDKTGTLTSNEMQLREIAIKGVSYGDANFKWGP